MIIQTKRNYNSSLLFVFCNRCIGKISTLVHKTLEAPEPSWVFFSPMMLKFYLPLFIGSIIL